MPFCQDLNLKFDTNISVPPAKVSDFTIENTEERKNASQTFCELSAKFAHCLLFHAECPCIFAYQYVWNGLQIRQIQLNLYKKSAKILKKTQKNA